MTEFASSKSTSADSGTAEFRVVACDQRLGYYLYTPSHYKSNGEIMVCVHGISRNVKEQVELYRSVADHLRLPMVAPLFDKEHFRGYQRLSNKQPGKRADLMLHKAINEVARELAINEPRLHLIGYSGGAQFAHRFALLHPYRIATLNLCSAGWYTFPDPHTVFPKGMKQGNSWPPMKPDFKGLLRIPIQVLVGSKDNLRDESLNRNKFIDKLQGRHRLARATQWYKALLDLQKEIDVDTPLQLTLLEAEGHDFRSNIVNAGMDRKIASFIGKHTIQENRRP